MNFKEGARRMRVAGLWMIVVPLSAFLLLWAVTLTIALIRVGSPAGFGVIDLSPCIPLVIPGAILWLAAWIMEGFAKDAQ